MLKRDEELQRVCIIGSELGQAFHHRAKARLVDQEVMLVRLDDMAAMRRMRGSAVLVYMKGTSLHRDPESFRSETIDDCRLMRPYVDGVLLFYGLCRNALRKMDKVSQDLGIPVTILRDARGQEIDDCFGAIMGGRESYLQHLREHRGTMFIIPGYAEHWRNKLGGKDVEKALEAYENLRFVFDRCGYTKLLRIDTHLCDQAEFENQVQMFARIFDMELACEEGSLSVFESSYSLAKRLIEGEKGNRVEQEPPLADTIEMPL